MRVGLVGYGYWGRNVARVLREIGCLTLVCDLEQERRDEALTRLHVPVTNSYDALLDLVDAVAIVTPPDAHFDLALRALDAGRHVYVEKPLTTNYRHATRLGAVATERDLALMAGHLPLYYDSYRAVRQEVAEGALGEVLRVRCERYATRRHEADGSVLWGLAPHDVALVLDLLPAEDPSNLVAYGDDDAMYVSFNNGETHVEIVVDWLAPAKWRRVTVVGTDGIRSFHDMGAVPTPEPLRTELEHFVALCGQDSDREGKIYEAMAVVGMLDEIEQAAARQEKGAA